MRRIGRITIKLVGLTAMVGALVFFVGLGIGPHTGRYRTMTVLTDSMRPTMPAGSVAVQTPMPVSEVEIGDVITYRIPVEDQRIVTHRVVEVVEAGPKPVVVTQGDAVEKPDPWSARLEGPVVWRTEVGVPYLGYGLHFLRQPVLRYALVLGVPLLLSLTWLIEIWRPGNGRRVAPEGAVSPDGTPASVGVATSLARTAVIVGTVVLATAWSERINRPVRLS